ncbi:hypothetical protein [Microvirga sp. P5_D2]
MGTERSTLEVSPGAALALNEFMAAIQTIFTSKAAEPLSKRQQYIDALTEVAELLYRLGAANEGSKMNLLAEMLGDLRYGTIHEVLKPTMNGTLSSTEDLRGRAFAALAIEALCTGSEVGPNSTAQVTREQAAQYIARRHPGLSRFMSKQKQDLAKAIYNWDRQYRTGPINNREVDRTYRAFLAELKVGIRAIEESRRKKGSEQIADELVAQALQRCN